MTIEDAFRQLTSIRGWYKKCGIDMRYANLIKHRFVNENSLSTELIREYLTKAGYNIVSVEQWAEPTPDPIVIEKKVTKLRRKERVVVIHRTIIEPEFVKTITINKKTGKRSTNLLDQFGDKAKLTKKKRKSKNE